MADAKGADAAKVEAMEKRILELEAENKRIREDALRATTGFDESGTVQWTGRNMEEACKVASDKAGKKRFLTEAQFHEQDRNWQDRGMPGPNDLRHGNKAEIREFDAKTGVEINADPRLAPRTVAPVRVGTVVDETVTGL